jgi:riboflavin kinase, archaea type
MKLIGKVVSGLGKGKQFMAMTEYKTQFIKKLGFTPFEGTLNIEIDQELSLTEPFTTIEGFREFGKIKCHKAKLNSKDVILIVPEKTRHSRKIIEIISSIELRRALNLNDGTEVEIEVL